MCGRNLKEKSTDRQGGDIATAWMWDSIYSRAAILCVGLNNRLDKLRSVSGRLNEYRRPDRKRRIRLT